MLRQRSKVAVQLGIPIRKARQLRQKLHLIDETAAQAATVNLLQADQIVARNELRDLLQVT